MENKDILELLKEYLSIKEQIQKNNIEIAELEDRLTIVKEKIKISDLALSDKIVIPSFEEIYNLKETLSEIETYYEELSDPYHSFSQSENNDIIKDVSKVLSEDEMPDIKLQNIKDIISYPSSKNIQKYSKRYSNMKYVLISCLIIWIAASSYIIADLAALIETTKILDLLAAVSPGLSFYTEEAIRSFIKDDLKDEKEVYSHKLDNYYSSLSFDGDSKKWLLDAKKVILEKIEKDKRSLELPSGKLPNGDEITYENYEKYNLDIKNTKENREDFINLEFDLNNWISSSKGKKHKLEESLNEIANLIIIKCKKLDDNSDLLQMIKESDEDLYNEIAYELNLTKEKQEENNNQEVNNPKVITKSKKII